MRIFGFVVLLSILGISCHKEESLGPGFDMVFQRNFSIPPGIGIFDVHHFQLKNIPTDWEKYLSLHGKTAEDIASVLTAQATLGGVYGDADLSPIDRISVRIYEESEPNDYVEIAYRDPAPLDTGNLLPLIPSLADSKRFFVNPRFSLDVVIYLRRTTTEQSDVQLNLTMHANF